MLRPEMKGMLLLGIATGALALAGSKPGRASAVPADTADYRTPVELSEAQRNAVLAEMRGLLAATHGVLEGLTAGNQTQVSEAAASAGRSAAMEGDPGVRRTLPREFLELGVGTHQAFDALAADAQRGLTQDSVIARLATITYRCVACHTTYRLVVKDQSR